MGSVPKGRWGGMEKYALMMTDFGILLHVVCDENTGWMSECLNVGMWKRQSKRSYGGL
jgi:hypothetical protein